jgi:hypothetical protein
MFVFYLPFSINPSTKMAPGEHTEIYTTKPLGDMLIARAILFKLVSEPKLVEAKDARWALLAAYQARHAYT